MANSAPPSKNVDFSHFMCASKKQMFEVQRAMGLSASLGLPCLFQPVYVEESGGTLDSALRDLS